VPCAIEIKYRWHCDQIGSHSPTIKLVRADEAVAGGGLYVDMLPVLFEYFCGLSVDGEACVVRFNFGEIAIVPLPFL